MYIQDFTGPPEEVFIAAFKDAKLHPKKNPEIETAMRVIGDVVSKGAQDALEKEVYVDVMDAIAMFEVNNGEYAELGEGDENRLARDEYESGLDDAVEASLEKYEAHLSADWLGKNTVDTGLWESTDEDRSLVQKFAKSAAKEIYKQLTSDKTPAQVLSSAGILKADVEAALASHLNSGEDTMAQSAETLEDVVRKVKNYVGKDFDQLAVYEDIEMILEEDDEILAQSAAGRLTLTEDEVNVLQIAALEMEDAPTELVEMIDAYKEPSGRSKTAAAKKEKAKAKAEVEEGAVAPTVLSNLKECGAVDTQMAEALGVSRSTYLNYTKGKTAFAPDADQYAYLRAMIVEKANMMLEALAEIDGTERVEVA